MDLTIIASVSEKNVIGNNGKIPWRITKEDRQKYKGDMDRFRDLTMRHPVIMGRKTHDSIGKPLPGRKNIVLTSHDIPNHGIYVAHSIEEALKMCDDYFVGGIDEGSYVIGGGEVYRQFLPIVNMMEITRVHMGVDGDAFFPEVNWDDWEEVFKEWREDGYSFLKYERIHII